PREKRPVVSWGRAVDCAMGVYSAGVVCAKHDGWERIIVWGEGESFAGWETMGGIGAWSRTSSERSAAVVLAPHEMRGGDVANRGRVLGGVASRGCVLGSVASRGRVLGGAR